MLASRGCGLANLALGNSGGLGMLFAWFGLAPGILVVGYPVAAVVWLIHSLLPLPPNESRV